MKQKKNNKQKYMSKQLHSKTGIKDSGVVLVFSGLNSGSCL